MANIKRIAAASLKVGMYISELNHRWIPRTNMRRHGPILQRDVIDQIIALGVEQVYIDADLGLDCAEAEAVGDGPLARDRSVSLQSDALKLMDRVMVSVKTGSSIPVQQVEDMADGIVGSLTSDHNAMLCVTRLRDKDRYLLEHSFNVAVLMGILARSMSFDGDDLHQLVTGALLHDIGKVRIADDILHKPGRLLDDEWDEMKRHVDYGCQVLDATAGISGVIRDICSQHHERIDGTGYPRGLSNTALSMHGRMAAIVDVYDAITADRVYHRGMAPTLAMKKLHQWSEKHLDRELVYQFIRCMSIYPAGSLVALDNDRLAIVLEANTREHDKPLVEVIYSRKNRQYLVPQTLDLSRPGVDTRIARAVEARDYGINLADFI